MKPKSKPAIIHRFVVFTEGGCLPAAGRRNLGGVSEWESDE